MLRKKILTGMRGFSLVEIIVILLIISGLAIFSYLAIPKILARARDAQRKSHFDTMSKSLEQYKDISGCFPAQLPACGDPLTYGDQTYLDSTYCDPKNQTSYLYLTDGAQCPQSFELYTNLELNDDPSIVKIGCDYGCGPSCQYNYGVSSTNKALNTCKPAPKQYACTPDGDCAYFDDPTLSRCPVTFPDDPTCQGLCVGGHGSTYRCHDNSGKYIP